jgi:hypothetical protein
MNVDKPWENLPDAFFDRLGTANEVENDVDALSAFETRMCDGSEDWLDVSEKARGLWGVTGGLSVITDGPYVESSLLDEFVSAVAAASATTTVRAMARMLGVSEEELHHAVSDFQDAGDLEEVAALGPSERLTRYLTNARQFLSDLKSGKFDAE